MRTARELLSQYAEYHRDRRNIATHFVGIPLIVFSVAVLLARVPLPGLDPRLSAATLMWVLTSGFYLSRHLLVGARHQPRGRPGSLARSPLRGGAPVHLARGRPRQLRHRLDHSAHRSLLRGPKARLCR